MKAAEHGQIHVVPDVRDVLSDRTPGALPSDPRLSSLPAVVSLRTLGTDIRLMDDFPSLLAVMSFRTILAELSKHSPLSVAASSDVLSDSDWSGIFTAKLSVAASSDVLSDK